MNHRWLATVTALACGLLVGSVMVTVVVSRLGRPVSCPAVPLSVSSSWCRRTSIPGSTGPRRSMAAQCRNVDDHGRLGRRRW